MNYLLLFVQAQVKVATVSGEESSRTNTGRVSRLVSMISFFLLSISLCRRGLTSVTVFNFPLVGSHIPSSGRLCMPAQSVCFRTPRHLIGHPGSLKSAHDLKCMRTQTAPLFNVPRGRRGKQVTAWT